MSILAEKILVARQIIEQRASYLRFEAKKLEKQTVRITEECRKDELVGAATVCIRVLFDLADKGALSPVELQSLLDLNEALEKKYDA